MEIMVIVLYYLLVFAFRAFSVIFCVKRAEQKNRKPAGWAIFALFLPIIAMIIISSIDNATTWHTND